MIGAGRVGRTVAARLPGARLAHHGDPPRLDGCRRLLLATPDGAIEATCRRLAPHLPPGAATVHFSGATSIRALAAAPGPVACVHPLQTVWPELGADQLEGAHAAVTGDWEVGATLARELGTTPFPLADEAKPVYHAAAAVASNYLVTLTAVAVGLLGRAGLGRDEALAALAPLQRRTIEVAGRPPTGPVARGDTATVAAHLEAVGPELAPLLRELMRATLPLVAPESARAVADELSMTLGLVPTMGALHGGHVALLRAARAECSRVVMSLFVNPLQFDDPADLSRYPRDAAADRRIAAAEGVDEVLAPTAAEMYPDGFATTVHVAGPAEGFEGTVRPGHFDGVATVVTKLFTRTRPDVAYFGAKDAQQVAVVRRLTADLGLPVRIRVVPTVRDPDGLALSSRNALLSPAARRRAPSLHRALVARDPALVEGDLEYFAVVDPDTFREAPERPGAVVVAAARFDGVRLIDNIVVEQ